MVCKGICIRHKASGPISSGRYATGQKRCQTCDLFMQWGGIFCPCCGYRLRNGPRLFKHKAILRMKQKENKMQKVHKNGSNVILHAQ
jgi:uncharacterized Zn finger protein (UPF0148 family)